MPGPRSGTARGCSGSCHRARRRRSELEAAHELESSAVSSPRLVGYGWGLGLVLLSIWPVFRVPPVDSYPLSTYPMFSQRRGQPRLYRMLALDDKGAQLPLPPQMIANSEALQAAATIRRAVDGGTGALKALCSEVAARVSIDPE